MPTIFKNITDLPVGVTVNGADVFELVQNGTNVQVTANTVAAAIGGGGGGGGVTIVTGSPFGVTVANPGKLIFDNAPPGALWLKSSGTDASGWLQLI